MNPPNAHPPANLPHLALVTNLPLTASSVAANDPYASGALTVGQVGSFLTLCRALASFSQSPAALRLVSLFTDFPAPCPTHLQRALARHSDAPEVRAMLNLLQALQPSLESSKCST